MVQAQLLYNSTDASSFFFLFLKITIVIIIVIIIIIIIIIRYYYCYYRYFIIGMYIEIFIFQFIDSCYNIIAEPIPRAQG